MRRLDVLRGWRERWRTPEIAPIARRLASELVSGEVRTESPFAPLGGRVDLRGLQVDLLVATLDPMYQRFRVHGGHWDGLDLSGAGLSGMGWEGLRITDCVFDDAQLDDLRCWGIEVADCVARRASLRYGQIGWPTEEHPRSSWRRIDLEGADLRQLHGNVVLEDVNLSRAKFSRTSLGWSDLNRVRFQGTVQGLTIGDLPANRRPADWTLRNVDLSETTLRDLNLHAVDLGSPAVDIRLPEDDEQWIVRDWLAFLGRVADSAPSVLRFHVDGWVDHQRGAVGPDQVWGFVALRDARKFAGEPFVDLLRASR